MEQLSVRTYITIALHLKCHPSDGVVTDYFKINMHQISECGMPFPRQRVLCFRFMTRQNIIRFMQDSIAKTDSYVYSQEKGSSGCLNAPKNPSCKRGFFDGK